MLLHIVSFWNFTVLSLNFVLGLVKIHQFKTVFTCLQMPKYTKNLDQNFSVIADIFIPFYHTKLKRKKWVDKQ